MPTKADLKALNTTNIRNKINANKVTRNNVADGIDAAYDYTDQQVQAVQASLGGVIAPGRLLTTPKQRFAVQPGVWTTIAQGAGVGVITKYWLALYSGDGYSGASGGGDVSTCLMRVSVDGEATPSLFGLDGAAMTDWFCFPGAAARPCIYHNDRMSVSANDPLRFGAHLKLLTPFTNGYKVEFFNTCPNPVAVWAMVESTDNLAAFPYNPAYRLQATVSEDTPAPAQAHIFYDREGDIILAGYLQKVDASANNVPWNFEGDTEFCYDGEAKGSYRSSGNEDMYETSYTWEQDAPRTYTTGRFVPYFSVDQRKLWGAVFFPYGEAPRAATHLALKHYNGDADYHTPPGPIVSRITTFVYTKPAAATGINRLAAPAITTSPLNGGLKLAWGGVANATSYTVTLDGSPVTATPTFDSATNTYSLIFTGLGTGNHTATVQAVSKDYQSSFTSSGTVTVTTAPTTPAILDLTVDPASPNVVLVGGLVASVSDGTTTFNSSAGNAGTDPSRRPAFVASAADFNNNPIFQLTGAEEMEGGFAKATESTFSLFVVGQFTGLGAIFGNRISNIDPVHYYTAGNGYFEATKLSGNTLLYNTSSSPKLLQVDVCQSFIRIYENEVSKAVLLNPAEYISDTYQNLVALFATVVSGVPSNFLTGKFAYLARYGGGLVTDANRATISAQLKAKFGLQY